MKEQQLVIFCVTSHLQLQSALEPFGFKGVNCAKWIKETRLVQKWPQEE